MGCDVVTGAREALDRRSALLIGAGAALGGIAGTVGSLAAATPAAADRVDFLVWCSRCQQLWQTYTGTQRACPGVQSPPTSHLAAGSYVVKRFDEGGPGQDRWATCEACASVWWQRPDGWKGQCAGTLSGHVPLLGVIIETVDHHNRDNLYQLDWRWCRRCSSLFYTGYGNGRCAADWATADRRGHDSSGSMHYVLNRTYPR